MSRPGIVDLWLFCVERKTPPSFHHIQYTKDEIQEKKNKPLTQVTMPMNRIITMQDVDLILLISHDIVYILLPCHWWCLVDVHDLNVEKSSDACVKVGHALLTHIILSLTHVKNSMYDELENNIGF